MATEHSALIDAIGKDVVRTHFGLTPQRLYAWRVRGVPFGYRGAFAQLAAVHRTQLPDDFFAPPPPLPPKARKSEALAA